MTKIYLISCGDVGIDCEFEARAGSVQEVIELCAEHGRTQHAMQSFEPRLYAKMRACIREADDAGAETPG